ncbi:DUF4384 domain-containing protein [Roseofilum sp. BLCC_M154]|uniref:DUF4384 domain-containing protein n=1 Tax=Roseofilum acuticapitatum BLCC-M154 TaxID=3022444 RepID=A0ABT7AVP2_9CYAN|nr:DUF4384 domain-containing protein [Roseofilum acuticapitatum]MDJ1170984.1 DUF4384 domain-containing protein [Roseofilum acuticapitatum BLCC-M154]
MQPIEIPERYEGLFLESIAKSLNLSPVAVEVFKTRVSKANLKKQWCELTAALPDSINGDDARKNIWWREIREPLQNWGFDYQENGKKLWLKVREWLEQTKYEPWLWEMLRQKAQLTQQMGFLEVRELVEMSHLGARRASSKCYVERVKMGSELKLEMTVAESTHLTLLEREPNGTVVCLCPSEYARQSLLTVGVHEFPQKEAPYPTFAATEVGKERWLALLTPDAPRFRWLEQSRAEALELQPVQLQEVLDYVSEGRKGRLLYTEYEVY